MKPVLKGSVLLGYSQEAVYHGDQGAIVFNGLDIPSLILVEPFGLARFIIDFHGPAVASATRDTRCLPRQAVGAIAPGII